MVVVDGDEFGAGGLLWSSGRRLGMGGIIGWVTGSA